MDESTGHLCPECGAPRGADNTPSCACTQRASDALRDARTAEAAAAEDFDPLRIRPYVELDGAAAQGAAAGRSDEQASAAPTMPDAPPAEATMPLRAVGPAVDPTAAPAARPVASPDADATVVLPAVDATAALPTSFAPPAAAPVPVDPHLFEGADGPGPASPGHGDERPGRRRRRTVLLGVCAAVVSVVAAAGIASGLFSYETPSRDGAPPQDVRAAVPDASTSAASVSPSAPPTSAPPTSASPSASVSESPSPTASPSASASSASPSPSRSAEPTRSPTSSEAADAGSAEGADEDRADEPVLSRGDRGPEVTELQQRLRQLHLYNDEIDGNFTDKVENALRNYQWSRGVGTDTLGVYDEETRAKLESETAEP
ncbi:peptidoglycan-binding protein [Streptomyces sp. AC555_RSS877]|uniref:peptidoglycan-binding protein n=1 Tax=Streptomyces sp. AC555_RSS877 TaxID=2823688 RepID=UPI001C27E288|nr:peptidoglycan-binding protein [Streptomyces sp. AC555_RSS877]